MPGEALGREGRRRVRSRDAPDPLEAEYFAVPFACGVAVCNAEGDVVEDVVVNLGCGFAVNEARREALAAMELALAAAAAAPGGVLRKTRAGGN